MGLCLENKESSISMAYSTFNELRVAIAKYYKNEDFYKLYNNVINFSSEEAELNIVNYIKNTQDKDLIYLYKVFFNHSDAEGVFTKKEVNNLFETLSKIEFDENDKLYDFFEDLVDILSDGEKIIFC